MLFDSTAYLVFLILVVLVYWRLPFRKQNFFLLAASYFFYGWWDWRFLFLMGSSTLVNFTVSRQIDASTDEQKRKALLIFSLILNFAFLGFFKYFEFFLDSFIQLATVLGLANIPLIVWKIVLPPAISFYTFQEVAYIVDVYQRKIRPADQVVDYALFVSLFPHLIAGPIQQPSHLLPQVQKARLWNPDKAFDGLMLILEGIFRKVVIADNCALIANAAFGGGLGPPSVWVVLLGVYAFAWQIYGDFSGYSCVARGSDQVLGFHFMINFRQPYLAESLQDFWRRWHISLVARLPLHTAGRQSTGQHSHVRQPHDYHAFGWTLAWSELDICCLGRDSRGRTGDGATIRARREPRFSEHPRPLDSAGDHFSSRLLCVDIL